MPEPSEAEQEQDGCGQSHERDPIVAPVHTLLGTVSDHAESVGTEEHATQGLTLENGVPLAVDLGESLLLSSECGLEIGVVRVSYELLLGAGDLGLNSLGVVAQLRVGVTLGIHDLVGAHRTHVKSDDVGLDLGLFAGEHLLACVLDEAGNRTFLGGEGVGVLERDLLCGELLAHEILPERHLLLQIVPCSDGQVAPYEQQHGKDKPSEAEEHIKCSAFHG